MQSRPLSFLRTISSCRQHVQGSRHVPATRPVKSAFFTDNTTFFVLGLHLAERNSRNLASGDLWASIPVTVIWLLGTILGIQLVSEGAALGYLGWDGRKT
jgi:hypothetical protein